MADGLVGGLQPVTGRPLRIREARGTVLDQPDFYLAGDGPAPTRNGCRCLRPPRVLIAGITTRALAISAAHAGYRVTAVDAFGDMDLRAKADVMTLSSSGIRFLPTRAAVAARGISAEYAAYTSNFENYPRGGLTAGEGSPTSGKLARSAESGPKPDRTDASRSGAMAFPYRKPARRYPGAYAAAGMAGEAASLWRRTCHKGVARRRSGIEKQLSPGAYRRLPGSIVFAADGRQSVPLGLSRQLVGDSRLGARVFRILWQPPGRRKGSPLRQGRRAARPGSRTCRVCDLRIRARRSQWARFHRPRRCALPDRGQPSLLGIDGAGRAAPWSFDVRDTSPSMSRVLAGRTASDSRG